jgi:hypothetical protein
MQKNSIIKDKLFGDLAEPLSDLSKPLVLENESFRPGNKLFGAGSACVAIKAKLCFAQVGRLASTFDVAKDATPNGGCYRLKIYTHTQYYS